MRFFIAALFLGCVSSQAGVIPIVKLDETTKRAFSNYVVKYESTTANDFYVGGKLWIDSETGDRKKQWESGKPILEPGTNAEVAKGSIHHFTGTQRIKGATIEQFRHIMEDYPNYVKHFKPDVSIVTAELQPDSKPNDEHYRSNMFMEQSTVWMSVAFDTEFDTHYRRLDSSRWISTSSAISMRELKDPKHPDAGHFPEGEDHGFLWKTNTYWFVRERDGWLEMSVDSMTLSRPAPTGFGWWATRRTKDAVEKMLRDIKTALETNQ